MAVSMGRVLNVPPVNLSRINIPREVADILPREIAHSHKIVPVSRLENKMFLAMADPLNVLAIDDVKRITKLEVAPLIAAEKSILDKLNHILIPVMVLPLARSAARPHRVAEAQRAE